MSESRFEYAEELLSSCARSQLARYVASTGSNKDEEWKVPDDGDDGDDDDDGRDESCTNLHQQHALHYGRSPPKSFTKRVRKQQDNRGDNNINRESDYTYLIDGRLERFVQTVLYLNDHNSKQEHLHRLALNQFADQDSTAFLVAQNQVFEEEGSPWETLLDFDSIDKEWSFSSSLFQQRITDYNAVIDIASNLTIGKGGMAHLDTRKKRTDEKRIQDVVADKVKFPDRRGSDPNFAIPSIDDAALDGDLLKVKPRKVAEKSVRSGSFDETDEFGKYLNWATEDNPDRVSIVKDAFDQGECGSCWAFAAAGSLEASVSRRQARDAYIEYLETASLRRSTQSIAKIHEEAVEFAQSVEKAAFQMANLSIQELIDCDTAADQGCIGGNPLLAFYFIHRYGLTSWGQYPYAGFEDNCHTKWVSRPVAKVKAWGIISPNHENHMELVLRFIGPIAVGVNGGERSFLAYQDGIFDKPNCKQGANHALLITGYGQEETERGDTVKYWIARNSWGTGWGENGYIRIRRGDGRQGTPGVCGIARSPSVALGGVLLTNRHRLAPYHAPNFSEPGSEPLSSSESTTLCIRLGFESCSSIKDIFEDHRALVLGLTGILFATLVTVWPLTFQCRRRRQRRRARREILTKAGLRSIDSPPERSSEPPPETPSARQATEADPLLGDREATVYGA